MTSADTAERSSQPWASSIGAITIVAEDLETTKAFYTRVFDQHPISEDDSSAAFKFGDLIVNVIDGPAAQELIAPGTVAPPSAGARFQFTLLVPDVDTACADLKRRGVTLLNGPMDRPWGIRTASFQDPAGHIWEITTW